MRRRSLLIDPEKPDLSEKSAPLALKSIRQSRRHIACEATLASGCGCPGEADTVSERSTLAPVPGDCSLKRDEVVPRIAAFEAVFTNGFIASERAAEGVRWRFANSAQRLEELRALADEERGCCGFFRFNVYRHGSEIRWDTVAAPEHRAALELWHQLPERVRAAG